MILSAKKEANELKKQFFVSKINICNINWLVLQSVRCAVQFPGREFIKLDLGECSLSGELL